MQDRIETKTACVGGSRRARILWHDEKRGEDLWLVLTGTEDFLEELSHAGYRMQRLPDLPRAPSAAPAGPTVRAL